MARLNTRLYLIELQGHTKIISGAEEQKATMTDNKDKKLPEDFDTTAELWDRIADDVAARGTPCYDTVEELLEDASEVAPQTGPEKDSKPEKE